MWVQVGSKMAKRAIFILATSLPMQFFSKNKVLNSHSLLTLSKLKDELTGLYKTLLLANGKRNMPSESLTVIHESCRAKLQ